MSCKPILFNGKMVQAIQAGRKTQTRRVVVPQPCAEFLARGVVRVVAQWPLQDGVRWFMADGLSELRKSPWRPGDTLWVKEAWAFRPPRDVDCPLHITYRADETVRPIDPDSVQWEHLEQESRRWRSPIHMPRWASRLTLEVEDVRVEPVQEISPDEALAEGVRDSYPSKVLCPETIDEYNLERFRRLWDSINANRGYGWETNPWVRAVTFRRIST